MAQCQEQQRGVSNCYFQSREELRSDVDRISEYPVFSECYLIARSDLLMSQAVYPLFRHLFLTTIVRQIYTRNYWSVGLMC